MTKLHHSDIYEREKTQLVYFSKPDYICYAKYYCVCYLLVLFVYRVLQAMILIIQHRLYT